MPGRLLSFSLSPKVTVRGILLTSQIGLVDHNETDKVSLGCHLLPDERTKNLEKLILGVGWNSNYQSWQNSYNVVSLFTYSDSWNHKSWLWNSIWDTGKQRESLFRSGVLLLPDFFIHSSSSYYFFLPVGLQSFRKCLKCCRIFWVQPEVHLRLAAFLSVWSM